MSERVSCGIFVAWLCAVDDLGDECQALAAADKGIRLIARLPETVKSPGLTGDWEARLRRIHGREATVIHPPIDVTAFRPTDSRSGRFLVVARLRPYKRLDLAIAAAERIGAGLDVVYMQPKEGRTSWYCGFGMFADTQNYYHAHAYADSWTSTKAAEFLLNYYAYGHTNTAVDLSSKLAAGTSYVVALRPGALAYFEAVRWPPRLYYSIGFLRSGRRDGWPWENAGRLRQAQATGGKIFPSETV